MSLCIGLVACLALCGGPALAEECFTQKLEEIEAATTASNWKRAQRLAHRLDRRIIFKAGKHPESCLQPTVARLAALRGIVLAAKGELDRALWLWQGARAIEPDQLPDLDAYPVAQALGVERIPAKDQQATGDSETMKTRESTIPRLLNLTVGNGLKGHAAVTGYLSTDGLPIRVEYESNTALLAYIVIDLCSELPHPQGVTSVGCSHNF